jgi:hypothetical protein
MARKECQEKMSLLKSWMFFGGREAILGDWNKYISFFTSKMYHIVHFFGHQKPGSLNQKEAELWIRIQIRIQWGPWIRIQNNR